MNFEVYLMRQSTFWHHQSQQKSLTKFVQRVDPESQDGWFTKIFNFFDRFFNYWTDKGNVGDVDDNIATSANDVVTFNDNALKRTDDGQEEDAGVSSVGN